jgi:hypothetical protein
VAKKSMDNLSTSGGFLVSVSYPKQPLKKLVSYYTGSLSETFLPNLYNRVRYIPANWTLVLEKLFVLSRRTKLKSPKAKKWQM